MTEKLYNGYTLDELAQIGFNAFRADGMFVWKHVGDQEHWRRKARAIAEALLENPKSC